ncbi:metal ABC transporter substrate-binding protein, partial [candidate division NPL-UPA2 bacterium]|nr:metal ABC transporter substrate-binding protein [candidate division NPL-UPA2 bacterium]
RRLSKLSPKDAPFFQENLHCFNRRIEERLIEWQARLEPFRGEKLITFHKNWPYFAQRFGLIIAGELEPRPGIPPSPAHLREIINLVRRENIRVILQAVFYDERPARFVARETGARVVIVPNSVGGTPEAQCYFSLIDIIVDSLVEAWEE